MDRRGFLQLGTTAIAGMTAVGCSNPNGTATDRPRQAQAVAVTGFPLRIDFVGLCAYINRPDPDPHMRVALVNYALKSGVPKHYPELGIPDDVIAIDWSDPTNLDRLKPSRRIDGTTYWDLTGRQLTLAGVSGNPLSRNLGSVASSYHTLNSTSGCPIPQPGKEQEKDWLEKKWWNGMVWVPKFSQLVTETALKKDEVLYDLSKDTRILLSWIELRVGEIESASLDNRYETINADSYHFYPTPEPKETFGPMPMKVRVRYTATAGDGASLKLVSGSETISIPIKPATTGGVRCSVFNWIGPGTAHASAADHFEAYYHLLEKVPETKPIPQLTSSCDVPGPPKFLPWSDYSTACTGSEWP